MRRPLPAIQDNNQSGRDSRKSAREFVSLGMGRLTTHLALRYLLNDEDMLLTWLRAGYSREERSRMKYRLERDQLSLDKIEEVLEKCGFTVAQEKMWHKPALNS